MSSSFFNKFNNGQSNFVTAGMQLKYIADYKPDDTAIIYIDKEEKTSFITWSQLYIQSNKLAWMLMEKNIKPGSVIMVAWPNCIEHIIAAFAIWKVGACYLPVSSKTADKEFVEIGDMISPTIAFAEFEVPGVPITLNYKKMYESMEGQSEEMPEDIKADPNMISLSGGTSGNLKLIRQNMPSGISDDILQIWFHMSGMGFEQRQLLLGPLFHGAPHTAAFNGLFSGNTLVIPRNLCAGNIVRLIKKYQIEYAQMVPILLNRIIKIPGLKIEDFDSIKAICHTSGYCSDWLKKRWIDLLGPEKIHEIYSMTEVIGLTCIRGDEWLKHTGSIGRPICNGKVSIRNNQGKELPPRELGEIYMTFPDGCFDTEYMNKEQLETTKDGFRSVGDFGYIDEDGYLYFVDRRNDMLVTGGENVFVNEVETALLRHEGIMDAIVVGIPDEEWGRLIHAVIESTTGISEEELRTFLRQYLSPYKIPKTFEFVNNLTRVGNGKTDRDRILREYVSS
ncbi:bile acid--CoA ligase BaiB [Proteocatella sphenisci]|uniref:bile acid--CoA ligase BaiB n=1 Tax=Proteocatella sphenisci TaxID=181070 RepID=UPI0004AF065E|nr:bile acid--CoA ligase BaiB [Proteocatella sphenisci]